jgi:hypothetical protein
MTCTLAQRAQLLANALLLASYVPDAETPTPGSPGWTRAVELVAAHLVHVFHATKHTLLRSGPPPRMPALNPRASAATKALLTAAKGGA